MPTFEEQIQRLEAIVKILDRGEEPIANLLELYEEGMTLSSICRNYLETAEQRTTIINNKREEIERQNNSNITF